MAPKNHNLLEVASCRGDPAADKSDKHGKLNGRCSGKRCVDKKRKVLKASNTPAKLKSNRRGKTNGKRSANRSVSEEGKVLKNLRRPSKYSSAKRSEIDAKAREECSFDNQGKILKSVSPPKIKCTTKANSKRGGKNSAAKCTVLNCLTIFNSWLAELIVTGRHFCSLSKMAMAIWFMLCIVPKSPEMAKNAWRLIPVNVKSCITSSMSIRK